MTTKTLNHRIKIVVQDIVERETGVHHLNGGFASVETMKRGMKKTLNGEKGWQVTGKVTYGTQTGSEDDEETKMSFDYFITEKEVKKIDW
jgi:hypothetical protein